MHSKHLPKGSPQEVFISCRCVCVRVCMYTHIHRGIVLRDEETLYTIKAHLWPADTALHTYTHTHTGIVAYIHTHTHTEA